MCGNADTYLMELATSIADKILMEYGKLVSIKFISEEDFNKRKMSLIDEIKKGITIYDGRKRQNQNKRRA